MQGTIAFAIGIGFALFLYPTDFLFGSPAYRQHVQGDTPINWIAYMAFAYDDWRWPLFLRAGWSSGAANYIWGDGRPLHVHSRQQSLSADVW